MYLMCIKYVVNLFPKQRLKAVFLHGLHGYVFVQI